MTDFKWCEVCEDHVQPEAGECPNCCQVIDLVAYQESEDDFYLAERERAYDEKVNRDPFYEGPRGLVGVMGYPA